MIKSQKSISMEIFPLVPSWNFLHDKLGKIECDITKSKCADLGDPINVYTIREYI